MKTSLRKKTAIRIHNSIHANKAMATVSVVIVVFGLFALPGHYNAALAKRISAPPIVSREEWGSKAQPIPEEKKQIPKWITIHHAGELWHYGEDPAQFVRNMQTWGQNRPKLEKPPRDTYWPDLPYHFLIAPDGRIFEGRPVDYEPESNTKYDLNGNIGIEMMGDFNVQRPSIEQLKSCVELTAWLCKQQKIPIENIRTHQDIAKGQTDCPGKDFYRYISDGQFKTWVQNSIRGRKTNVVEGEALKDGPSISINDPSTKKEATPPAAKTKTPSEKSGVDAK